MPGASLFALLDDIASILDDVSVLTKVAATKTAGVLGDDLALNAQQVSGVRVERELPVVWAVAKGSLVNKAILVPAALSISAFAPWAVMPLLMLGGAYLCFEGVEKLAHGLLVGKAEQHEEHAKHLAAVADLEVDLVAREREKVRGAVRTDFVLSAEIVTIALGSVAAAPFLVRSSVLVSIALLMTVGVYGLVAAIVKVDDLGIYLHERGRVRGDTALARTQRLLGAGIMKAAPLLMKGLSIAGTIAMFLVGGGILLHGIPAWHDRLHHVVTAAHEVHAIGGLLSALLPALGAVLVGVVAGTLVLLVVSAVRRVVGKSAHG